VFEPEDTLGCQSCTILVTLASIFARALYAGCCAHKGTLSKTKQAVTSDLIPSASPADINELRDKQPEPTHRHRDPTTQPASSLRAQKTEERMQGLRGRLHLRAQPSEEPMQGLRGRLHLRAPPPQEHLQGLRGRLHLRPPLIDSYTCDADRCDWRLVLLVSAVCLLARTPCVHCSAHRHMQRRAYMLALADVYIRNVTHTHSTSHICSRSDTFVRTRAHAHANIDVKETHN
jgi:hypothetical protein